MTKNLKDFQTDFIKLQTTTMKESYPLYFKNLFNRLVPGMTDIQIKVDQQFENAAIQFKYKDVLFTGQLLEDSGFDSSVNPYDIYKLSIETMNGEQLEAVKFPLYIRDLKSINLFLEEKTSNSIQKIDGNKKEEVAQSILRAQKELDDKYSLEMETLVNNKTGKPHDTKLTYEDKTIFVTVDFREEVVRVSIENGIGERFNNGNVFLIRYKKEWNINEMEVDVFIHDLESVFKALHEAEALSKTIYQDAEISYDFVSITNQNDEIVVKPSANGFVYIHKMENAQPLKENLDYYATFTPPYYFFKFNYDKTTEHLTISYMADEYSFFCKNQLEAIQQVIDLIHNLK